MTFVAGCHAVVLHQEGMVILTTVLNRSDSNCCLWTMVIWHGQQEQVIQQEIKAFTTTSVVISHRGNALCKWMYLLIAVRQYWHPVERGRDLTRLMCTWPICSEGRIKFLAGGVDFICHVTLESWQGMHARSQEWLANSNRATQTAETPVSPLHLTLASWSHVGFRKPYIWKVFLQMVVLLEGTHHSRELCSFPELVHVLSRGRSLSRRCLVAWLTVSAMLWQRESPVEQQQHLLVTGRLQYSLSGDQVDIRDEVPYEIQMVELSRQTLIPPLL